MGTTKVFYASFFLPKMQGYMRTDCGIMTVWEESTIMIVIMLHVGTVTEYKINVTDLVAAPVILLKIRQSDGMCDTQKLLQHLKDLLPVPG